MIPGHDFPTSDITEATTHALHRQKLPVTLRDRHNLSCRSPIRAPTQRLMIGSCIPVRMTMVPVVDKSFTEISRSQVGEHDSARSRSISVTLQP